MIKRERFYLIIRHKMVNVYLIQAHVTENRKKSEVSENSKVEQIFKRDELQEDKVML